MLTVCQQSQTVTTHSPQLNLVRLCEKFCSKVGTGLFSQVTDNRKWSQVVPGKVSTGCQENVPTDRAVQHKGRVDTDPGGV